MPDYKLFLSIWRNALQRTHLQNLVLYVPGDVTSGFVTFLFSGYWYHNIFFVSVTFG